MNIRRKAMRTLASVFLWSFGLLAYAHDFSSMTQSSVEFLESLSNSILELEEIGVVDGLEQPGFGSEAIERDVGLFIDKLQQIGITRPNVSYFGYGDASLVYDIILQPGHFLRERCCNNKTGSHGFVAGRIVYEQDFVAYVGLEVARLLSEDGLRVLVVPADLSPSSGELRTKVFLAMHLDGSTKQCTQGSSLGYSEDGRDFLGAHAIGLALARARGIEYEEFSKDNYAANLRDYYAFDNIQSTVFEAVVELAELSCPEQALEVFDAAPRIVGNIALMLGAIAKMEDG